MEKKKAPLEPLFDKIEGTLVSFFGSPKVLAFLGICFIIAVAALQASVFFVGHSTGEEICTGYFCN